VGELFIAFATFKNPSGHCYVLVLEEIAGNSLFHHKTQFRIVKVAKEVYPDVALLKQVKNVGTQIAAFSCKAFGPSSEQPCA
jgi:hypothetical protein